jgi:hypothetical protein
MKVTYIDSNWKENTAEADDIFIDKLNNLVLRTEAQGGQGGVSQVVIDVCELMAEPVITGTKTAMINYYSNS